MRVVKPYTFWILLAFVVCVTNGVYSYEEHWQGDRIHCFVDNEIKGIDPVTFSAAGWPWCFYQHFQCPGSDGWFAWDSLRLLGNFAFWFAVVLFAILFSKPRSRNDTERESLHQDTNGSFRGRQWRLADFLFLFAMVASGLGFFARIKARYAESQSLAKEIQQAGGMVSEGYYLPSFLSLFAEDMNPEWLKPLNRIVQVSIDHPSKALLQKVVALPRLKSLRISGCGELLAELKPLRHNPNLRDLRISGCKLDNGTIELLSHMKTIQSLNLMRTNITASGLTALGRMPRLRFIHLGGTDVELADDTLKEWMRSVRYLHLPRPKMGGASTFNLNGWPELQEVRCFEYDELINSEPVHLSVKNMPKLQTLAVERLQRFDLELSELPQLREIIARDNQVSERSLEQSVIPSAIWIRGANLNKLVSLRSAKFFVRDFTGLQIDKCPNLECEAVWAQAAEQRWEHPMTDSETQALIAGIGHSIGITELKLTDLHLGRFDITPIKNCSTIKKLEVGWGTTADQLEQLAPLTELRELRISALPRQNSQALGAVEKKTPEPTNAPMSQMLKLWPSLRRIDMVNPSEKAIHLESHRNLETAARGNWHSASTVKIIDLPRFSDFIRLSPRLESLTIVETPNLRGLQTLSAWPDDALIEGLSHLEHFSAGGPNFKDKELDAIVKSREMVSLTLAYCGMTSEGLKGIGKFKNLETLVVSGSDVDDATVCEWKTLHKLKTLMLDRTKITDESISWLHDLKALQHLNIDADVLSKLNEHQLSKFSGLQSISIHGKTIPPLVLSAMVHWKQLSMVRFDGAKLDAGMLKSLAACLTISTLHFYRCEVSADELRTFAVTHPSNVSMSLIETQVSDALKNMLTANGRLAESSNPYWWNPNKPNASGVDPSQNGQAMVNSPAATLNAIEREGNQRNGVPPNRFAPAPSLEGKQIERE